MMLASHSKEPGSSFSLPEQTCQRFTLAEIQSATNSFDKTLVIGHGGFGTVYKCVGKVGTCVSEVAVKRLDSKSKQGATEFETEVKILSKLRHGNLVPLVGYCHEGGEMLLAYEFMPNGTLKSYLSKAESELSWLQRIKICVGIARGLGYLHTGISTQHGVIHRDLKTSNILLDANFDAKISDFGLARVGPIDRTQTYVSTDLKGTCGYLDPSCWGTQKLTRKSDVYAFGVVLMEVLSGRQALDLSSDDEPLVLADWARDQIKKGKLNQMIDGRLKGQISKRCLKHFTSIAGKCLHIRPKQRPTMANIVDKLESILTQERDRANSVVAERRFIYNIRWFLWGKGVMIPDNALGSKSMMPNPAIERIFVLNDGTGESKSAFDALGIRSVSKEGVVGSKSTMPHGAVGRTSVWQNCAVGIKYVMHLGSVSKIIRKIHEGTKISKTSMSPVLNTMSLKHIRPQSGVFFPGYKRVKRIFKFARTVTRPKYYLGCVAATRSENRIGKERRKSVSYGSRLMPRYCIYTGKHTSV